MKRWLGLAFLLVIGASFGQGAPGGSADLKQLDALRSQYTAAKAAYKQQPSSKAKAKLVVATDKLATATMTSEALDARKRYPEALGLYQDALLLDPSNKEALNNASMIDSVYKGMIEKAKAKVKANPNDKVAAAQLARFTGIYSKIHRPLP
jgi:tetratricopeptide (TPR) repeat protein